MPKALYKTQVILWTDTKPKAWDDWKQLAREGHCWCSHSFTERIEDPQADRDCDSTVTNYFKTSQ